MRAGRLNVSEETDLGGTGARWNQNGGLHVLHWGTQRGAGPKQNQKPAGIFPFLVVNRNALPKTNDQQAEWEEGEEEPQLIVTV